MDFPDDSQQKLRVQQPIRLKGKVQHYWALHIHITTNDFPSECSTQNRKYEWQSTKAIRYLKSAVL
jgi:hypothetical protein